MVTQRDRTSISCGRFILNKLIVAVPTSVSPTIAISLIDQSKAGNKHSIARNVHEPVS